MTWAEWFQANAAFLPHQAAGLALLLGGLWLLFRLGTPRATGFFAAFLAGYGAAILLTSVVLPDLRLSAGLLAAGGVAYFFASSAMLVAILAFPRPLVHAVESRWMMLLPTAVAGSFAAFLLLKPAPTDAGAFAFSIGNTIPGITTAVLVARLTREPPGSARRSLFLLTVGLGLQGAYFWTGNVARLTLGESPYQDAATLGFVGNGFSLALLLAGVVLLARAAFQSDRELAGLARFSLLVITIGAAIALVTAGAGDSPWFTAMGGVTRLVFAGLVTWGVLRHQFLGVDLRVRWAIGRSTVAATFIAVFFIASEAAQEYFGDTTGSTYLGIAAAGTLVFAIAPLQRAAERLAEKAVPVATPPGASAGSDNEDLYLRATGLALRDRVIAPEEELDLIELAERLGIGARRAAELRMAAGRGSVVRRRKTAGAISRSRTGRGGRDP